MQPPGLERANRCCGPQRTEPMGDLRGRVSEDPVQFAHDCFDAQDTEPATGKQRRQGARGEVGPMPWSDHGTAVGPPAAPAGCPNSAPAPEAARPGTNARAARSKNAVVRRSAPAHPVPPRRRTARRRSAGRQGTTPCTTVATRSRATCAAAGAVHQIQSMRPQHRRDVDGASPATRTVALPIGAGGSADLGR